MAVNIEPLGCSNPIDVGAVFQLRPLIDRCVAGDETAWRDLHNTFHPMAFRFLRRLGLSRNEIDDACQEVFVQVFRYLARFEQRSDFKTWLYKLCLTQVSRQRRRTRLTSGWQWLCAAVGATEASGGMEWSESFAMQKVQGALDRMKAQHREVFVLYELEGLSGEEIARIVGCPHATIRRRLHHARQEFEAFVTGGDPKGGNA